MTSTTTRQDKATAQAPAPAGPLPKMRRRPGVVAAGIVAAITCSLGLGWLWSRADDAVEVVVATRDVPVGAVIEAGDLGTARIPLDPALDPIVASRAEEVVGQRAGSPLTAGSLVTEAMLEAEALPPDGMSLVPVTLPAERADGLDLRTGDRVKVVMTPPPGQLAEGNPQFTTAEVATVRFAPDTSQTVVSLLVGETDGPVLAARLATGNFYLVLDSRER